MILNQQSTHINIFYYDAEHTYDEQLKFFNFMLPKMHQQCIMMVDDLEFENCRKAFTDFCNVNKDFKHKILEGEHWWKGFGIAYRLGD